MRYKIHWRSIRLFVNAGMAFPACYATAELLDLDKGSLPTTGNRLEVTCKRCKQAMRRYDRP